MRLVSLLLLAATWFAAAAPARAFDFSDARRLIAIHEAQISPDGTQVAFVESHADYGRDRNVSRLMLLDVRTHAIRPLTYDRKGVDSPRWSPDGRELAFTASAGAGEDAAEQVFVLRMDGGDARQVTHAQEDVAEYAWSPDGARIAYVAQDSNPKRSEIDAHHDAFQVGDNDYLHESASMPSHLWVVGLDGGNARRLTSGAWSAGTDDGAASVSWSADGRNIAIVKYPTPYVGDSLSAVILCVDVRTGATRRLTGNSGLEVSPAFAPRGSRIAFVRPTGGNATNGNALFVTSQSGGSSADIRSDVDRNVDDFSWSADGNALYFMTPDGGNAALWYRPVDGHAVRIATGGTQAEALGNVARNGALVFVGSTRMHPPELYLLASPGAKPVALTDLNAAAARAPLGRAGAVDWTGPNGFHEDGILTYPPGYDVRSKKKLPLVLLIHGGPQGASTLGWSPQAQLFASHGYLVFQPNYRGSTNLGDAYQRAIAKDAGDGPGKDVMAGVAAVESLGIVDQARIAVSGWSYGGFMTSWLIGHYHIWKTAVTGASLDDWLDDFNVSFYVYTDVPYFGGVPSNPKYTAMWRAQSPIAYANRVTTPTLILGDIGDDNVTITNSFKLYHALKDNNVPVTFVAYPVHGHHPPDPVRNEDINKRWLAWLDRYLK